MPTRQELLEKFIIDFEVLADLYGKDAVETAVDNEYEERFSMTMAESKNDILREWAAVDKLGRAILGIGGGIVGAPLRGAGRAAGGALRRGLDQDVNISSQDSPLDIESDAITDLISQTNKLVQGTNDLLSDLASALELSNKGLGDLDLNMDDLISRVSGKSIADVRSNQGALQVGAVDAPDLDAPEEEPGPEEEPRSMGKTKF